MASPQDIPNDVVILVAAESGWGQHMHNLITEAAVSCGVPLTTIICSTKDGLGRGIAHYCTQGDVASCRGKFTPWLFPNFTSSFGWMTVIPPLFFYYHLLSIHGFFFRNYLS